MTTLDSTPVDQLRARVSGRVVDPGDPDYDALRVVVLGGVDPRPALIVRPADDADVAAAVGFAREHGLPLAVRSGGHSGAGHGTVDDGLVVDLRDLRAVDVDVDGRSAWVGAGATAGEVTAATAAHGLVVGFGDTGSVGVGGLTLGGGVGYLSRAHGLTVDNLLAADVVLADGRVVRADAGRHPDLFWALRGGGGNLGVVTRFRFRLHPLDGVTGGILLLPASAAVLAGFVAALQAAPDELSAIVNVMPCPPMPFVPAEHHGRLAVMALVCWSGPAEGADAVLAPFRALAEPLADLVRPVAYPELFPPADPEYHPTAVARTLLLDHVDLPLAERLVERLTAIDGMRVVQLRALGGAIARVPADATAYAHRSSRLMGNVAAFVTGPEDRAARAEWVAGTAAVLDQGDTGAYVNFLGDEGPERVRAAYPGATWDRLAAVKATYDPGNVFCRNQNVPPAV
ncbi:FAD-binding oxidoreductase [Cellulomonas sp. Marseille-Q8402]